MNDFLDNWFTYFLSFALMQGDRVERESDDWLADRRVLWCRHLMVHNLIVRINGSSAVLFIDYLAQNSNADHEWFVEIYTDWSQKLLNIWLMSSH